MARRNYQVHEVGDLTGGQDFDSSPFTVPRECLISCSNVLPSTSVGGITIRNGIIQHNATAISETAVVQPIVGLHSLYNQGGFNEFFVAVAGTKIYKNQPDGTWTNITDGIVLTANKNNLVAFAILNNKIYASNRLRNQMWYWDLSASDATPIIDPPNGKPQFVVAFNRRIFTFGNSDFPLLGDYSDIDDGSAYTALNFLNYDEGMGSKITGAARRGSSVLVVFKDKSITFVEPTGTTPPFTKYLFVDGIGCVSHQSIVTLPGGMLMWWDDDDIYMMVGNEVRSATVHPSTKQPRLRNFFRNEVNAQRLPYVVGCYYPLLDVARFFYTPRGQNENTAHIDYHVKTRSWWPGTLRGNACCTRVISGKPRIYAGDTDGKAYRQDFGTSDNGSAIVWNARTPWQVFEGMTIRKKLDMLIAIIERESNFDLNCDIYFDQSNTAAISDGVLLAAVLTGAQWDVSLFDVDSFAGGNTVLEATLAVNRLFKSVSVDFKGSILDNQVNIHKLAFVERPLEFTRGTN